MKVGFVGLGCEKNIINTEQMIYRVQAAGHQIVSDADKADTIVINTCGFITSAKTEAIETIMEVASMKKDGIIKHMVVCGCLPERYKDSIAEELPEVDAFIGVGSFQDIVEVLDSLDTAPISRFAPQEQQDLEGARIRTSLKATAYIKIADGCDNCCTYCAIPYIRGRYQSRPMENIVAETQKMVAEGAKEIILIAQDTTLYGSDLYGEPKLCELLDELVKIEGIVWIRMLYLYPDKITDKLLDKIASEEKLIPYIEMPLQHSEEKILKTMNRPGSREELLSLIAKIREKLPNAVLRTTLITGFPGEGEKEFEGLVSFVKEARFDRLGVFPYSAEEGTPAAGFEEQVDEQVKIRRAEIIEDVQSEVVYERVQKSIGKRMTVLIEDYDRLADCCYTRSYGEAPDIDGKIFILGKATPGEFVEIEITDNLEFDLIGEIVQ